MTLFALQLLSILPPEQPAMTQTDIFPEQTVARMLAQHDAIIAGVIATAERESNGELNETSGRHFIAALNADLIARHLEEVGTKLLGIDSKNAPLVLILTDKARQLQAFHLWHLDGCLPF